MKVKALEYFYNITKGNIYEVVNKLKFNDDPVCVKDDANTLHWLTFGNFEIIKEPTLKEQYLVSGNVVETREGKYLVVENSLMSLEGGFNIVSDYNENLKIRSHENSANYSYHIVKVYKITNPTAFKNIEKYGQLKLIWQSEPEIKEVTMEELEKHYGCKVKVVK